MKTAENSPQSPMDLTQMERNLIRQALILGESPTQLEETYNLPAGSIVKWVAELGASLPPSARRQLALARIDVLGAKLIEHGMRGDVNAVNAWVALQKREAALAGLDAPTKQESEITVHIPWLESGRLGYKREKEMASDITSKAIAGSATDVAFRTLEAPVSPASAKLLPPDEAA